MGRLSPVGTGAGATSPMTSSQPFSRVVFVRHGQTDFNAGGRVQGQVDIELNEVGREQARRMAPMIASLSPSAIVTSNLLRARDTAEAIGQCCDAPVIEDERLRERFFGHFEGMSREEMIAQYPQWFTQWRQTGEAFEAGVEGREEVGKRFVSAVMDYVSQAPGTYVFVSHGSAITQAMTCLLGLSSAVWAGLRGPDNCHWSILEQAVRPPHWRLLAHNLGVGSEAES